MAFRESREFLRISDRIRHHKEMKRPGRPPSTATRPPRPPGG